MSKFPDKKENRSRDTSKGIDLGKKGHLYIRDEKRREEEMK